MTAGQHPAPVILFVADRKISTTGPWVNVDSDALPHATTALVAQQGGVPLMVPVVASQLEHVERLLDLCDGVLCPGGRDVDASLYGAQPHPTNDAPLRERDELEIALVRGARERGIPVLGMCRGMQVVNVAAGGTLLQHLAEHTDLTPHRDVVGEFTEHEVRVTPGTTLASIVGATSLSIASHHHQAVDVVAPGFTAVATAPDGIVEAIEADADAAGAGEASWCVGVQWHPEEKTDEFGMAIMRAFVDVARAYRSAKA